MIFATDTTSSVCVKKFSWLKAKKSKPDRTGPVHLEIQCVTNIMICRKEREDWMRRGGDDLESLGGERGDREGKVSGGGGLDLASIEEVGQRR